MEKRLVVVAITAAVIFGLFLLMVTGYFAYKFTVLQDQNRDLSEKVNQISNLDILSNDTSSTTALNVDVPLEHGQSDSSEVAKLVTSNQRVSEKTSSDSEVLFKVSDIKNSSGETAADSSVAQDGYLKISDVKTVVDGFIVNVSWNTNKASDSRLELEGGKKFASDSHDSTSHHVKLSNIKYSSAYSFNIIAEVNGEKDTYYDDFETERKFVVSVFGIDDEDDECLRVVILDTEGIPLQDTLIQISGAYHIPSMGRISSDTLEYKTDNLGSIKYCDLIDEMKVKNLKTGDIYLEGLFSVI